MAGKWLGNGEFTMKRLRILPRILVGGIFLYASVEKILYPASFAEVIANYDLLPHNLNLLTAFWLPWLEVVLGIALLFGKLIRGSALIATLLMTTFSVAVAISYFRGIDISCGCFSVDSNQASNMGLVLLRDGAILIACILALKWAPTHKKN